MVNKSQVAGELRDVASELARTRQRIPDWQWRTGITPHPAVARAAQRACAAWAWIVRGQFAKGFGGHTHVLESLPARHAKGDRPIGRTLERRPRTAHARLDAFAEWAASLPGAKGVPGGRGGELWLWACRAVAEWLDAELPKGEASARRPAMKRPPDEAFRALKLVEDGMKQEEVARNLKTTQPTVSRWCKAARAWRDAGGELPD